MANDKWLPWIGKAVFESALIVFSVLIAMAVDDWRDTSARRQRLDVARANLVSELEFNRDLLNADDYLPHHVRLHDVYEGMEVSGKTDRADAMFQGGVHAAPLRDAAWRSFVGSDVAGDLPFAQRVLLEGVYGEQAGLRDTHRLLIESVASPRADREAPAFVRDFIRTIDLYLTDIVYAERRLLAKYDEAVKGLGTGAADKQ
jgi:hypothetical protein